MAALNSSLPVYQKLPDFFSRIREGQAPQRFTRQFIKDMGFKSSNWQTAISLLKGLGFLTSDGSPTATYMQLLDSTRWQVVLAEALKSAYSDIFQVKRVPTKNDLDMIVGKYKSTYNSSDVSADRAARTFLALLALSDKDTISGSNKKLDIQKSDSESETIISSKNTKPDTNVMSAKNIFQPIGLNYHIQIHLPVTKDLEVYNAIFKSLKEHIIEYCIEGFHI